MNNNRIYLYIFLKKMYIINNINLSNFINKNIFNNISLLYILIINEYYFEDLLYKKTNYLLMNLK